MATAPASVKERIAQAASSKMPAWPGWSAIRSHLWPESGAVSPIPALDGLRAVAVIIVVLYHAWLFVPGIEHIIPNWQAHQYPITYGRTGVQLFFVLSGFLLTLPYARWIFGLQSQPSPRMFYKRRILRVGPAYWVSLTLIFLAGSITLANVGNYLLHLLYASNATFDTAMGFNVVYWTMSVEVQFYAVLPLLAWVLFKLAHRWSPARAAVIFLAGLVLISVASDMIDHTHKLSFPYISTLFIGPFSLLFHIAVFGSGMLCALAYVYLKQIARLGEFRPVLVRRLGTGSLIGGVALALLVVYKPGAHLHYEELLMGFAYAGILFGLLFGPPLARRPFESRPMRFVGLISYSVYLWHVPIMNAIDPLLPVTTSVFEMCLVRFLVGFALTIVVAYISFQLTERPFFAARKKAHDASVPQNRSAIPIGAGVSAGQIR